MKNIAYMKNITKFGSAKPTFSSTKLIVNRQSKPLARRSQIVNTIVFAVLLCLLFGGKAFAQTIIVNGTGTNQYVPMYNWYNDYGFRCEYVIPASYFSSAGITNGARLNSITLYRSATGSWTGKDLTIKLTNTSTSYYSSTSFLGLNGTTVYTSSSYSGGSSSSYTFNFSSPFTYTGGSLVVHIYAANGGTCSSSSTASTWYGISSTSNYQGCYASGSSSANATTGTRLNFLPKTAFTYTAGPTNGTCANATSLPCGTSGLSGTTVGTTGISHNISGASISNYGVWYTFMGNGASTDITVVATSGYDHKIVLATGSCDGGLTQVAYKDGTTGTTETLTYTTQAGVRYYVYVAHYSSTNSSTAAFTISRSCGTVPDITMQCGVTYEGVLGTSGNWSSYPGCSWNEAGEENIYVYTPPVTGSYTITMTQDSGDPDFFLMSSRGNTGTCYNYWNYGSTSYSFTGGTTYYLIVDNCSSSSTASYTVRISCPSFALNYAANPSAGGTVSVSNNGSSVSSGSNVEGGTVLDIVATPAGGYFFSGWTVSGSGSTVASPNNATTTLTMGQAATTLTANFTAWNVTVATNPSSTECLTPGTQVKMTASTNIVEGLQDYIFTTGTGGSTYSPSWTTMVASGNDDVASSLFDIGFPFVYDGVTYEKFSANSNGNLRLGSTVISSSYYSTPLGSSNYNQNEPKIIGIGKDMSTGAAGYVKTGLSGSAGSYIRVTEFMLNTGSSSSGTTYVKFQVQLFQATGEVRIVYTSDYSNAPSGYQVGIGNASSNKFWHVNPSAHSASYSTTYNSSTYSVWPGGGRYYSFKPVALPTYSWTYSGTSGTANGSMYTASPTTNSTYTVSVSYKGTTKTQTVNVTVPPAVPTNLQVSNIGSTTATISWSGSASSYQYRVNSGSWNTTTSTSVNLTDLTAGTSYTFQVKAVNGSCESSAVSTTFTTSSGYTLTISVNPSNSGNITHTGGTWNGNTGTYTSGSATLTASANAGYTFQNWTIDGATVTGNPTTITMNANHTARANFQLNSYTISVSANPTAGGTVSGGGTYSHGQSCTVTASTNTGYTFNGWYEGNTQVSSNSSYTFTVSGERTLVAKYTQNTYTVRAAKETGINTAYVKAGTTFSGTSTTATVSHGGSATFKATVSPGYTFDGWYYNSTRQSTNLTYTRSNITGAITITAKAKQNTVTITGAPAYVCTGTVSTLTAIQSGFTSPRYTWSVTGGNSSTAGLSSSSDVATVRPTEDGTYTYQCSVTENGTGTAAIASVTIIVSQGATITFPVSSPYSTCENVNITPRIEDATCSDVSWAWSGDYSASGTGTTVDQYTVSAPGTYSYTFTVNRSPIKQYDMITRNGIAAIVVEVPTYTTDGIAVPIGTGGIGANASADNVAFDAIPNLQEAIRVNGGTTYDSGNRTGFKIPAGAESGVCQSVASMELEINTPPTLTRNTSYGAASQTVCKNSSINEIRYSYSGGEATFTWTSGTPEDINVTNSAGTIRIYGTPTASGTFGYSISVASSSCDDPTPLSGTIKVNPLPEISVTNKEQTVCYGNPLSSSVVTATNANISYTPSTLPTGISYNSSTHTFSYASNLAVGTYTITVNGTSNQTPSCGSDSETITIKVNPLPEISVTNKEQTVCYGNPLSNSVVTATNANISYTPSTLPTGISYNSSTHTFSYASNLAVGTYTITVTGTSNQTPSCGSDSETITIKVNPLPTPTISQADNYTELTCSRTSIMLTANGSGGTFEWSGGGTDNTKEVSEAGTYTVTETKNGCHGTSEGYEITSNDDVPTASISGNNEICLGGSTTLETTSDANYTYSWSNSVTTYTNTVAPTTTTEYKVTTTDTRNDCSATAARTVTVITPNIDDSSYDYIWRGVSTDWNTESNWYVYSAGNYNVATELPSITKNIYIGSGRCLTSSIWPLQTSEANANNITIASGASLTIPASKTLNIAGSITNNGTFTANNSSTIVFKGSTTQTLSSAMTFGNVTFAQTALDTIKAPNGITVNGTATFNKGIVMGEMTFNAGATAANVTDSASFVAGKVTKHTGASAETNFIFPTGSAGEGQPKVLGSIKVASLPANSETYVVFNQKSNGGGFSESEMPRWWNQNNNCEGNDPLFDHISNFEFWNVSTNSTLTADITVSANNKYAHFSPNAVSFDGEDIFGAMWQGGCWKKVSDHAVVSDPKTITISGVTIPAVSTRASEPQWLSMGSKNHETLLPIELVSFTADCDGHSALVEWTTATEKNNDYFSLERSDDAINFTEIARVAGAGNSIEPLDYSYTDYGIHSGDNYYRLVQVDYDGTRTASEIIVANCIEPNVGEPDVQAYPNPFNDDLTIELDNFGNRPARIEVFDMLGKLIYTGKVAAPQNYYETILNLSNLPPAAYNIRVSTNDFVINKNVVKQ